MAACEVGRTEGARSRSRRRRRSTHHRDVAGVPDGPFARAEVDLDRGAFFRQVADGRIRQVLRGVYVSGRTGDSIDLRVAAAAKVLKPGQILVDRSAAWVHGTDAFGWGEKDVLPATEVCAPDGLEPVRRVGIAGGRRDLRAWDLMTVAGVPVTTPLRTAADLGCRLRRREAYAAMCDLGRRHGFTGARLQVYVDAFRGRRGVVQFRELAPLIQSSFESPREAWMWLAIHDAGLPSPMPQVWVQDRHGESYRLDLAYERLLIAIEYDGAEFHDSDEARRRDQVRRRRLADVGWRFVIVRRGDFKPARVGMWTGEIRRLLADSYSTMRW